MTLMEKAKNWYLILILWVALMPSCRVNTGHECVVEKGVLDLGQWQPKKDGPVYLDGEWEFYWQQLISPDGFTAATTANCQTYFNVPGLWNHYKENTNFWPGDGYATFRLRLAHIPSGIHRLYLKIPVMPTAYKLWADGRLIAENGRVGKSKATMIPQFVQHVVHFAPREETVALVLQVSNFFHKDGGIWHQIELGTGSQVLSMREIPLIIDILLFGALLMMGLYHVGIFSLRRQEKVALWFGCFCLFIGLRSIFVGQRIFHLLFPIFSWQTEQMCEYMLLFLSVPAFCAYFHYLFPRDVSPKFPLSCAFGSAVLCFIVLVTPAKIFTYTTHVFQWMIILIAFYMAFKTYLICRYRREGSYIFLCGFVLLLLTVVNDILFTEMLVQTRHLSHFGVFLFVFFQAYLLTQKYSSAFDKIEEMSDALTLKNKELMHMDQLKTEFLANTSHELKTPLHGILGIAESMASGMTGTLSPQQQKNLSMIVDSGRRLFHLINDLLDFSRMKRKELHLDIQPVDLKSMVHLVFTVSQPLMAGKKIALETNIPDQLPPVRADEGRLQQILFNLVGNAIKFTSQGKVTVAARLVDERIRIKVIDTGIGIAKENQARVFFEFEQVDGSIDRPFQGAGLGLAITKWLLKLHGSEITLSSELNHGSEFSFDLPVHFGDFPAADVETIPPDRLVWHDNMGGLDFSPANALTPLLHEGQEALQNKTILVVDDEPINVQLIYNYLNHEGYRVMTAGDGAEALDIIASEMPDLILLDIMMPIMNGFEACQKIRAAYDSYLMPVIMLSAKNQLSDVVQGFKSGANDYLTKPFFKEELLARIRTQLHVKESVEHLKQNRLLKNEIARRKKLENELRTSQRRLTRILDSAKDAIIAVDQDGMIIFFNQGAEQLLGYSTNEMLHQPLAMILPALVIDECMRPLNPSDSETLGDDTHETSAREVVSLKNNKGQQIEVNVHTASFTIDNHLFITLILKPAEGISLEAAAQTLSQSLFELGTGGRQTLPVKNMLIRNAVEPILRFLRQTDVEDLVVLRESHPALDAIDEYIPDDDPQEALRRLMVKMVSTALLFWETTTGKSKIELAEESRIWKAHLDGGTWKTRTLDKYLKIDTIPKKPRWREVLRTAHYVLSHCKLSDRRQKELHMLIDQFESLLAKSKKRP